MIWEAQYKVAVLALVCVLASCDNVDPRHELANGELSTRTPENLREVPNSELTVEILIDGRTTTYFGQNFPDGVWRIDLDVEAERSYDLLIRWFFNEHLLMEESGVIYTDSNSPSIRPDLNFATVGEDRFDTDCDGIPNIDEVTQGLDPGSASLAPCTEAPFVEDPSAIQLAWLAQNFTTYNFSGIQDEILSIEQEVQIRESSTMDRQFYSLIVNATGDIVQPDGSQTTARATVQLIRDPSGQSAVNFFTTQALSAVPNSAAGVNCVGLSNSPGFFCNMAFDPIPKRWYKLSLVESGPSQWQALVVDKNTGSSTLIATMELPAPTRWSFHSVDLGFDDPLSQQACSMGLNKITAQFIDASINGSFDVAPSNIVVSPCVSLSTLAEGVAWSAGSKKVGEQKLYSLSIGN